MKPVTGKATEQMTRLYDVTDLLMCPSHPRMWVEEFTVNGEHPDTTVFCSCCSGECSVDEEDDCDSCNKTKVGA